MELELAADFRYEFKTAYRTVEGVVASADCRVIRFANGDSLLRSSVQELTPLYKDDFKAFSDKKRKALAKTGAAMKDGSYPIESEGDLSNAVQAYGRSPDEATKAHIVKRAKALGATDKLPEDWPGSTKNVTASAGPPEPEPTVAERVRTAYFAVASRLEFYSEDQMRDAHGRFGGGGAASEFKGAPGSKEDLANAQKTAAARGYSVGKLQSESGLLGKSAEIHYTPKGEAPVYGRWVGNATVYNAKAGGGISGQDKDHNLRSTHGGIPDFPGTNAKSITEAVHQVIDEHQRQGASFTEKR